AGAERRDQRLHFLVLEDLVDTGLLDVEDLAADREHGLRPRVAALAGGAARRVALDDEHLALAGVGRLAVHELAGQRTTAAEESLASGEVPRLPGGQPGGRGRDPLADDVLALARVLLEPLAQPVVDQRLHERPRLGVA